MKKLQLKKLHTKSNYISLFRLLLGIPIFIMLDYIDNSVKYRLILFGLCILAFISDFLDGYIARKFNEISELGKIIDPLADKVLMAIIVIKLYMINEIPGYYFWIILLRDVVIFTGGLIVSRIIGKVLPSNLLGKITVLSIGAFILAVILQLQEFTLLYNGMLYLSLILSFASVVGYGIRAVESIRWKKYETI